MDIFQEGKLKEAKMWVDRIIEQDPHHMKALDLWKKIDSERKRLELPDIFPANLGPAQTVDGIYGYLSRGDILALQYCARAVKGTSVNIGVFNGLSSYVIARANPELRVVGIDAFLGMTAQLNQRNNSQEALARKNLQKITNTEMMVGLSQELALEWDEPIEFLFIDGDHSVEGAVRDFEMWSPFLAAGGYIALHDAYGRVSPSIVEVRKSTMNHGPDVVSQMLEEDPAYEFQLVKGCTEVWRKVEPQSSQTAASSTTFQSAASPTADQSAAHKNSRLTYAPETCIVFVSYDRPAIAEQSLASLMEALAPVRNRVRVILSDASSNPDKIRWCMQADVDDVILTPRFTPAATSRNLATTLIMDKYSPQYLCFLEDDFQYSPDWYPALVEAAKRLYGVPSPLDLAYGIFSACDHHIPDGRKKHDSENNVTAYIFGAVAYQRFMPAVHYHHVMRMWDPDLLGISYAQTGGQTFRNTMRGFCGAVLPGGLSKPIDQDSSQSTWSKGKRDPGPPAHSFNVSDYDVIRNAANKQAPGNR